jgi:hypothetical protein
MTGGTSMTSQIADAITAWAKGKPRWTPVPGNAEIAAILGFTASGETFRVARLRVAGDGVIFRDGRDYYIA